MQCVTLSLEMLFSAAVVLAVVAGVRAATDPCSAIAGQEWVAPADVRACFTSFKVDPEVKANVSVVYIFLWFSRIFTALDFVRLWTLSIRPWHFTHRSTMRSWLHLHSARMFTKTCWPTWRGSAKLHTHRTSPYTSTCPKPSRG